MFCKFQKAIRICLELVKFKFKNLSCIKISIFQSLIFLKKISFENVFPAFYKQHFSEHMLMVASVNETPEDEIGNDTSFHFCN